MLDDANWSLIPEHCRDGVRDYIEHGRDVGDFLYAIATNNLRMAVGKADDKNVTRLADYVKFFHCYAPSQSWGTVERVRHWTEIGGLAGLSKARAEPELVA